MTYYRKYEFTAFTEADLLQGNDTNLNRGDSFVMGGGASVCISTWDNDGSLSGDTYRNENANDRSGQYASVDGARVGSQMYAESYHVLTGSDGNTYYLIEIEVEGYNAPGTGDDFFTFYGAVPPAGVELTIANTCNVKGCWVDYRCLGAGEKAPANTPPTFTNLPSDGIICVDENTSFVIDANASDADGDTLTYEIVGGRDAAFFDIDPATGELTFKSAPDYENPQSGGNNNIYDVTVKVSDGNGGEETKALWVKVKDVDESTPGECIVIEAEDMHEWGFKTVSGSQASGGELVKLNCAGGDGALWTTFNGTSGTYDLNLHVQDENDGQSTIKVKINGHVVKTIVLNNDNDGGGSNNGGFSVISVDDLTINKGDTITLWVDGNCAEYVRIDKIELCQDGEPCPEGFTLEDFTGENAGTFVSNQFDGFTVTAQRDGDGAGSANDAMIFDSANPTGGDGDLGYANQGNIIIISEDGDSSDPDDNAGGGTITFDFDNPSDLGEIKLLDIEETGGTIELFDANGNLINTIAIPAAGNNSIQTIKLNGADVSQMKINLAGSGAVDDLCFKPGEAQDPLPGSLSGTYFCDDNRDGDDDGALGGDADIAGKTVTLLNADGTPATDIDGNPVAAVLTDANGDYRFDNLAAGDYKVSFEATDGKEFIAQDAGNDDTDDSDVDPATGMTAPVTVVAGQETTDVDAGVQDILGSLSGRYFFDADKDGLDNDGAGNGITGVDVQLLDAAGNPIAGRTTTTDAQGNYSFAGLVAAVYGVKFTDTVSGKVLTTQDVDGNASDDIDSDALDIGGNMSVISGITVVAGQNTPDNDAGVIDPNQNPTATDDAGMGCADTEITVDLSDNYADLDSSSAGITMLGGLNIADGDTILLSGTDSNGDAFAGLEVTRNGDEFIFDGESAFAALDIGEQATANIAFKVEDSDGGFATANIAVTFCGDANSVMSLCDSLPSGLIEYQIIDGEQSPLLPGAYDLKIVTAGGDARFEGVEFASAYCLDFDDNIAGSTSFDTAPINTADMYCFDDQGALEVFGTNQSGINGLASDNVNEINWILNQQFESNGAGAVDGNFSAWEIQFAIWELTNGFDSDAAFSGLPEAGQAADTDFIVQQALAQGSTFEAGVGDIIGVVIDPNPSTTANSQPFIIGMVFEDYDCLC